MRLPGIGSSHVPVSRIRFLPSREIRSILSVIDFWSEAHSCECNSWAIDISLYRRDLGVAPILSFENFLYGQENAVDWQVSRSNQLDC